MRGGDEGNLGGRCSGQVRPVTIGHCVRSLWVVCLLATAPVCSHADDSGDIAQLSALLDNFLANTGEASAHDRFWADELVYTSSSGHRSGKRERMAAFAEGRESPSLSSNAYRGEEVSIQIFGTTAIVTFRLVSEAKDGSGTKQYLNTGTFLKRSGQWRAVAWQATAAAVP
jgi:hypothetical protein